mgnify:FL=1
MYGKESKKAPSLLKSNANHSLTYKCAPPHDWGQIPSVAGCAFYMSLNDWLCKDRKIFAMTLFEILNFNRELLERLENISRTNALFSDLRRLSEGIPRHRMLSKKMHSIFLERIRREESTGFVDYLTISSSLLFSGKYARNIGELGKLNFYNNIRLSDYSCEGYLDGLEVVCCDYRELTDKYRDSPDVVFLIDPPYMATDISTYRMDWKLTDYLDVLLVLKGHPFVYFTSGKSPILDFCRWMEEHPETGNPFKGAGMSTLTARMNYSSSYTDIMLYKETTEAA